MHGRLRSTVAAVGELPTAIPAEIRLGYRRPPVPISFRCYRLPVGAALGDIERVLLGARVNDAFREALTALPPCGRPRPPSTEAADGSGDRPRTSAGRATGRGVVRPTGARSRGRICGVAGMPPLLGAPDRLSHASRHRGCRPPQGARHGAARRARPAPPRPPGGRRAGACSALPGPAAGQPVRADAGPRWPTRPRPWPAPGPEAEGSASWGRAYPPIGGRLSRVGPVLPCGSRRRA